MYIYQLFNGFSHNCKKTANTTAIYHLTISEVLESRSKQVSMFEFNFQEALSWTPVWLPVVYALDKIP